MKKITVGFMLAIVPLLSSAQPEIKGNPDDLRKFLHPSDKTLTIYAEAEERAYSDKAIVSLVVTTEDKLLSKALSKNSEIRKRISSQLVAVGIAADSIKSSKFSTSPQFGWFGKKPSSYKVVNRMAISLFDERHMEEVAKVSDGIEEAEILATSFEHTKKDEFENRVKKQALARVMEKKTYYENSLGVKLVAVGVRDSHSGENGTPGAEVLEEIVVTAQRRESSSSDKYSSDDDDSPAIEPSFDEVEYKAGVNVDFKIE
jgi:uncharacterized protein YggE